MRSCGKVAFGGGYLVSTLAAQRIAAAKSQNDRAIKWELSPRELKIIKRLDAQDNTNDNRT